MAESLRRLSKIGTFTVLQEKLDRWVDDFNINNVEQNVARGCEIIELNARIQGQLFKLLSVCASEGGLYGGASYIRARLLPLLGRDFFYGGSLSSETSLSILAEAASRTREVEEVRRVYENSLEDLERDMRITRQENETLRAELEETKHELDRQSRASTSDKMFAEQQISDLQSKLVETESKNLELAECADLVEEKERKVKQLSDEVEFYKNKWPHYYYYNQYPYYNRYPYYYRNHPYIKDPLYYPYHDPLLYSDLLPKPELDDTLATYRYLPRGSSPLALDDSVQRARQQNLIMRFTDLFSVNRLDALEILRRYQSDAENNQRIVFTAVMEAFIAAKIAFRSYKSKIRSQLAMTHKGPETLEEAVQDYINTHTDLFDLHAIVQDVLRALSRNPKLLLTDYDVIHHFIREACRIAWEMSALAHPLDVVGAADAELFDENKYRRSYDSEFTAPLVSHHIWPALAQGSQIVMKGEAYTRRGASTDHGKKKEFDSAHHAQRFQHLNQKHQTDKPQLTRHHTWKPHLKQHHLQMQDYLQNISSRTCNCNVTSGHKLNGKGVEHLEPGPSSMYTREARDSLSRNSTMTRSREAQRSASIPHNLRSIRRSASYSELPSSGLSTNAQKQWRNPTNLQSTSPLQRQLSGRRMFLPSDASCPTGQAPYNGHRSFFESPCSCRASRFSFPFENKSSPTTPQDVLYQQQGCRCHLCSCIFDHPNSLSLGQSRQPYSNMASYYPHPQHTIASSSLY